LKSREGKLIAAQCYLLDVIYQKRSRTEEEVKPDFQQKFPSVQYAFAKHLLYHAILNHLVHTRKKESSLELLYIQILKEKGLYRDAYHRLLQATVQ
jgi:hypothetical protein